MHNVYYLLNLMKGAREAIVQDRYPEYIKTFFGKIYDYQQDKYPQWAVEALKRVNVDLLEQ